MNYLELRKQYGDPYVAGTGIEIGAGLRPVQHDGIQKLYFLDKRNNEEFEAYFGAPPPYELISADALKSVYPAGVDFINSHHVIEHLDNPIAVLVEWIGLLRQGGTFYLSIPSQENTTERRRMLTPLRHVLEDYAFAREAHSYDSKQHLYSFLHAMTASKGEHTPWMGKLESSEYARCTLEDIDGRDDHDAHWHTFDLETTAKMVAIAFHLAGSSGELLVKEQSDDSHYLLFRKGQKGVAPRELAHFYASVRDAAERLQRSTRTPWRVKIAQAIRGVSPAVDSRPEA